MRLGYLVPEFPNQTHAFFCREIDAIEAMGVPVRLYSTRRPAPGACPHAFAARMTARTTYLFPAPARALAWLSRRPGRALKAASYVLGLRETSLAKRAQLMGLLSSAAMLAQDAEENGISHLHIHSCANAAHLGALAHILGGLPFSLTLHGDLPVYGTDHAAKMQDARFVAAVTAPLAEQVAQVSPNTPAPVIWMGVDCNHFAPRAVPAAGSNDPVFEVATVARLNRAKGHGFFLQAMALLRERGLVIRYLIAGDGPERPEIEAQVDRLGLGDQVRFLGSLGEEDVLALLHRVDALALTSVGQGEAAPVTVMEAMACGLPVICSIIGGTPDMIDNGRDGLLVPQEDVAAIADAVQRLAEDPDMAQRIGRAAREKAIARFDSRASAARLLDRISAQA